MLWLDLEDAVRFHERAIHSEGSSGFPHPEYLESALYAPQQAHHYDGGGDLFDLAAVYLYHVAKAHAFTDGNKRTAYVCALVFLDINGVDVILPNNVLTLAKATEDAVAGSATKEELAALMRSMPRGPMVSLPPWYG